MLALERTTPERGNLAEAISLWASIGRLHIVAIAVMGCLTFGWIFTGRRPWLVATVCGLDWFLVNILNRAVDLAEDRANGIRGTALVSRRRRRIVVAGAAALAASIALFHLAAPAVTPLRVAYHALGIAYNWPVVPGARRLKQLYFWKNTASAAGFLITCFGYPLAAAGFGRGGAAFPPGVGPSTVALTAAFFFFFEVSYEVVYDLRDVAGDAAAGVRSYPAVHGERVAARIVDACCALAMALLAVGFAAGALPWRVAVMIAAPAAQLVLYRRALRRGITSADCVRLTWLGAGLLAAYNLWVAAGLPGVEP